MVELEADDALASAARIAAEDERVEKVCIWTVDKDLAQCVRGDRVVQAHRLAKAILDADAVRRKFGVEPSLIPDLLALVGDAADGYPGIPGIGAIGAARLLNRYGPIEAFPPEALGEKRAAALLFKTLATLKTDAPLFDNVDAIEWRGTSQAFAKWGERIDAKHLVERCAKVESTLAPPGKRRSGLAGPRSSRRRP
jgi:5'-3' exonuclease